MARVSKTTPYAAAAAASSTNKGTVPAAAAKPKPKSRSKKTPPTSAAPSPPASQQTNPAAATAAASSSTIETASAAEKPKTRSKKTTPPAAAVPSPPPPQKTAPAAAAPLSATDNTAAAVDKPKPRSKRKSPPVAASPKQMPPPAAAVIEIPDSPAPSASARKKGERRPLNLDVDGIEMWTPRQKRRIDEDCCILTADPLVADEAPPVVFAPDADDDIAVVAERGKVACRDYPHPRHACAKYPFASTPHESHCEQCFCYVCDIAAPCATWKGHTKYGHCHASDSDKSWKIMRGVARRKQCNKQ